MAARGRHRQKFSIYIHEWLCICVDICVQVYICKHQKEAYRKGLGGYTHRDTHTQHTHNTHIHTHTQAKEAYIKGAEWLGRHAVLQLDRLADKILPLIKKLYRHGAPGGTAVGVGLSRPARCVCVRVCACVSVGRGGGAIAPCEVCVCVCVCIQCRMRGASDSYFTTDTLPLINY